MTTDLEIGFELDRRWHYLRGEMEQSKKPALYALARIFAEAEVPYAVIGGIAFQVRADAPRTTLDIDVAVVDLRGARLRPPIAQERVERCDS